MSKQEIYTLHQNINNLNEIADRMVQEYNKKNKILDNGLKQCTNCETHVSILKGGGCNTCHILGGCDCSK